MAYGDPYHSGFTPQMRLDAVRLRAQQLSDAIGSGDEPIHPDGPLTAADLAYLIRITAGVWVGHEVPHLGSNVK